jgi:dTMP kinase
MEFMIESGKFIVFEGVDGSGTTTQKNLLVSRLDSLNLPVRDSCEPSSGKIGTFIREEYLSGAYSTNPKALSMLFTADRIDHLIGPDGIIAELNNGMNVIQDRYYMSSLAYDATTMTLDEVFKLQRIPMSLLRPTLTILIDIEPIIAAVRINKREKPLEIYDNMAMIKNVRDQYLHIASISDDNIKIINGNGSVGETEDKVWECVAPIFGLKGVK